MENITRYSTETLELSPKDCTKIFQYCIEFKSTEYCIHMCLSKHRFK